MCAGGPGSLGAAWPGLAWPGLAWPGLAAAAAAARQRRCSPGRVGRAGARGRRSSRQGRAAAQAGPAAQLDAQAPRCPQRGPASGGQPAGPAGAWPLAPGACPLAAHRERGGHEEAVEFVEGGVVGVADNRGEGGVRLRLQLGQDGHHKLHGPAGGGWGWVGWGGAGWGRCCCRCCGDRGRRRGAARRGCSGRRPGPLGRWGCGGGTAVQGGAAGARTA
jgi:hypothetical protein